MSWLAKETNPQLVFHQQYEKVGNRKYTPLWRVNICGIFFIESLEHFWHWRLVSIQDPYCVLDKRTFFSPLGVSVGQDLINASEGAYALIKLDCVVRVSIIQNASNCTNEFAQMPVYVDKPVQLSNDFLQSCNLHVDAIWVFVWWNAGQRQSNLLKQYAPSDAFIKILPPAETPTERKNVLLSKRNMDPNTLLTSCQEMLQRFDKKDPQMFTLHTEYITDYHTFSYCWWNTNCGFVSSSHQLISHLQNEMSDHAEVSC